MTFDRVDTSVSHTSSGSALTCFSDSCFSDFTDVFNSASSASSVSLEFFSMFTLLCLSVFVRYL